MLAQAKKDAQKKREELVKDAREKIDEEQKNWSEAILKQRTAFLRDLRHLSCEVRFIGKDEQKLWVNSSFKLTREKESEIRKTLEDVIGDKVEINFKVSPDLICGIETRTEGKKISWNIENYLDGLEEQLKKAFTEISFQELDVEKKKTK